MKTVQHAGKPASFSRRAMLLAGAAAFAMIATVAPGSAADKGEIRIGQTMPYSGVASAYGIIGQVETAYIRMINEKGGVNGRKINLISLDDAYSPPKTVEQTRKLVEQDNVLAMFGSVGTPPNLAVHKYLNSKKTPQLFISTGATIWNQPDKFPWTIGWQVDYEAEGKIYAKYVLKEKPDAKIAILYQHDDSGRDYIKGFKEGLGADNAKKMIVAEASYQVTDPTVDSQVIALKNSGADVLFTHATPKFGAQAIRKMYEIGWKPMHIITNTTNTIAGTLRPAGLEKSQGVISGFIIKDPGDPAWKEDQEVKDYLAFMKQYAPNLDAYDTWAVYGYTMAQGLVEALTKAGDDVTRESIMKQARSMNFKPAMTLPGVTVKTGPNRNVPLQSMQLARFEGDRWKLFGEVINVGE